MVKWLERLDHGAENRHEVVSSRLGFTMRQLEHSLCQPNSEWVPFRIGEGYGSDRRGMGSAFHQLCTKYSAKGNLKRSDFNFSNFIKQYWRQEADFASSIFKEHLTRKAFDQQSPEILIERWHNIAVDIQFSCIPDKDIYVFYLDRQFLSHPCYPTRGWIKITCI